MNRNHPEPLIPWRHEDGQMYINDVELLEKVSHADRLSVKAIGESRMRENTIRLQCRYLTKLRLLRQVAHDIYRITSKGERFLDGNVTYPLSNGYVKIEEVIDVPEWRISHFDRIDPSVIKTINEEFFLDPDPSNEYGWTRGDPGLTKRRIWNVKGWQLNRLMKEFPRLEPLPQQCAHWMRAMVGLHFFPDANHRTGMASLYGILKQNGVAPPHEKWPGPDIGKRVTQSKLLRSLHSLVRFDSLWVRDELYHHWHRHFRELLCTDETPPEWEISPEYLRKVLVYAREHREER